MPDEVRHLAARDARGDLDHGDAAVRRGDQLRECDPVAQPERSDGALGGSLGELELVRVDRRRVEVDPADAEADPRAAAAGRRASRARRRRRGRRRCRSSRSRRRTPRGSPRWPATPTSAAWRCDSRSPGVSIRKTPRCPPESTGFSTAGSADRLDRGTALGQAPHGGEGRLRDALLRERAAHRDLVRHSVGDVRADRSAGRVARSTAATTGTARSAETVRTPSTSCRRATSLDRVDVREVDHLRDVGECEPRRVGVPVDGDDAQARARAPGRSRGADGGRRRRRGRSTRRDARRLIGAASRGWGASGTLSARSRHPRVRVAAVG